MPPLPPLLARILPFDPHFGNDAQASDGCMLVGLRRNKQRFDKADRLKAQRGQLGFIFGELGLVDCVYENLPKSG